MHVARCNEEQRCSFVTVGNADERPAEHFWRDERSDKFDLVLAGILSKGHVLEAVALYLCVPAKAARTHFPSRPINSLNAADAPTWWTPTVDGQRGPLPDRHVVAGNPRRVYWRGNRTQPGRCAVEGWTFGPLST